MEAGRESSEEGSESVGKEGDQKRADQVEAVQKDQFGELCQIGDEFVVGGKVPTAGHPADVGPKDPFLPGRMDIDLLVGVGVMMPMDGRPPESAALDAEKS